MYGQTSRIQYLARKRASRLGWILFSLIMFPSAVETAFSETVTKSPSSTVPSMASTVCLM